MYWLGKRKGQKTNEKPAPFQFVTCGNIGGSRKLVRLSKINCINKNRQLARDDLQEVEHKRDLKLMYLVTHTDDRRLKCAHCDYRTKVRSDLKKHMKKHSVQNTYACDLCTYKDSSASRLMSHKLTHAKKDTHSYPCRGSPDCNLCDHKTSSCGSSKKEPVGFKCGGEQGALKTYMSGQNDEKPFKCNLCDYECKWSGTLKKHITLEHAAKEC